MLQSQEEQNNSKKDSDLQKVQDYINSLEQPITFHQLKQKFNDINNEELKNVLKQVQEENQIGLLNLFLKPNSKAQEVYIEYSQQTEQKTNENKSKNNNENNTKLQEEKDRNQNQEVKLEDLTDEQLREEEQKLERKKKELSQNQFNLNSKKNLLKKIQDFNQMKEICNIVFEKYAEINKMTLNEVCNQFGISEKDKEI